MKKSAILLAAALLTFSLTACGQNAKQSGGSNETVQEPDASPEAAEGAQEEPEAAETEEEPEAPETAETEGEPKTEETQDESASSQTTGTEGGKALVVYYSASGHTKEAAGYIANATGGDVFELVPAEPYSDADLDYNDENSRVVYEHEHPEERAVELEETEVSGWDSYDTVFIGYPIWWGIAAWPVDSFIAANDFTGKTVIPFCTSASSGLGESGELLAEAAGTGDWLEGERFSSGVSEETVTDWVESLNLK